MPQKHLERGALVGGTSTTLVGEEGQRVTLALVGYLLGLKPLGDIGPAAGYSEDGTLVLRVDEATFDALDLNSSG